MQVSHLNFVLLSFLMIAIGCNQSKNVLTKNDIKTEIFELKTPVEFPLKVFPIGKSNFVLINSNSSDTIFVDVGVYTWNLAELDPDILFVPPGSKLSDMDTSGKIISRTRNYDIDDYRKQNIYYDDFNGYKVKITRPRIHGKGFTGMYIKDICEGVSGDLHGTISLTIYGYNLSASDEAYLIEALTSIKINKENINCDE